MTQNKRTRRLMRAGAFIIPLGLLGAACGSDDPASESAETTDAAQEQAPAQTDDIESTHDVDSTETTDSQPTSTEVVATDPVVIGVISSYTGSFGIYGDPMELAMTLRLDGANNAAGPIPIQTVFEDDGTDPATAVQRVTKLVEQDGASVVVCCVNAGSTFAVAPILAEMGIPQIVPIANPLGLHENPNAFVAGPSVNYDAERMGTYVAEELGHATAVVMTMDMAYGQAVADSFTKGFTEAGGEVVDTIRTPFGTQDFGSFLASVPEADMVFGGYAGADAIAFVNQYEQFGIKDRSPLLGHGPLITELLLQIQGPAAAGTTVGFYYTSALENDENDAFKTALTAANPDLPPSHFTAGSWATASVLLGAIESAGAGADGDALREAIAATETETPWGPITFDAATGYVFGPTYVYSAVNNGGTLTHQVEAMIE